MCGIIGEVNHAPEDTKFTSRLKSLSHRGPDAIGYIELEGGTIRLGHQRLSIIDLSERGNQPMTIDGYSIVYNGEVYNFKELQEDLAGPFISSTDTEVILRGYIKSGDKIFDKLNGMFALAIYDPKKRCIVFARDRFGIKPLFYCRSEKAFSFASEMKALPKSGGLNPEAINKFLSQGYVWGEEGIYKNVRSILPGTFCTLNLDTLVITSTPFYEDFYKEQTLGFKEALALTDKALEVSVRRALISDVPVGVFLSGGVDSPLIASYARRESSSVKSFSIKFEDERFDESSRAESIAKHLGLRHQTLKLSKREVIDSIDKILDAVGEPLGDSSIIPTYFLSQFAKREVKVCLSGDGADEIFGGYPLYYLPKFARLFRNFPASSFISYLANKLGPSYGKIGFDLKVKQFLLGAGFKDPLEAHLAYRSLRRLGRLDFSGTRELKEKTRGWPISERLMLADRKTILPHGYLVKVDRLSMAHGLEVRVPFLDNEVVDLANTLPSKYKIRGTATKVILRKLLATHIPKELTQGPKKGFSFPISSWLRSELREYMLSMLTQKNLEKVPGLEYPLATEMIKDHLEGRDDCGRELWALIGLVRFISKN